MSFEQIVGVALGINTLITVFNAVYTIFSASGSRALVEIGRVEKAVAAQVRALEEAVEEDIRDRQRTRTESESRFQLVEQRLALTERELAHLPSKDSITEVKLEVAALNGSVGKLETTITSISRTVNLLDDYLRNNEVGRK